MTDGMMDYRLIILQTEFQTTEMRDVNVLTRIKEN
jgi:hypothetical protein